MARAKGDAITRRALVAAAGAGVTAVAATVGAGLVPAREGGDHEGRLYGGRAAADHQGRPTAARDTAPPGSDPAFAAIAAHRAAYARLDGQCRALSALEEQIPEARRQACFDDEIGTDVGADDDPRWTAALAAWHAADDAETDAAWALAHLSPSTLAGATALVRHAHDHADGGNEWPSLPEADENGDEDWYVTFHLTLAAALARLG
jgi:hypothetical protein